MGTENPSPKQRLIRTESDGYVGKLSKQTRPSLHYEVLGNILSYKMESKASRFGSDGDNIG